MITPNYLELCAPDLAASRSFYEDALGFTFTDYGDAYTAVEGGPVEIALLPVASRRHRSRPSRPTISNRRRPPWPPPVDGSLETSSPTPVAGGSSSSTQAATNWPSIRTVDPPPRTETDDPGEVTRRVRRRNSVVVDGMAYGW
jgi:catechol 2,3-dioxygenase-like lactoylglutathione lyase family enzyme